MTIARAIGLAALPIVVLLSPAAASADTPVVQVDGGYAFMTDEVDNVSFPAGWTAGVAVRVWRSWLSGVGGISGHYKTEPLIESRLRLTEHAFLGGARATVSFKRLREYGQFLVGDVRSSGTLFGESDVEHHFATQPGGGADFAVTNRMAIRGEVDVRFLNGGHQFVVATGLVFTLK